MNSNIFSQEVPRKTVSLLLEEGELLLVQDGNHGGNYPTPRDFVESDGIPLLTGANIVDGFLDIGSSKQISHEKASNLRVGTAKEGDLLLTHKGTMGKTAIVPPLKTPFVAVNPQITIYRINPSGSLDVRFLRYYFDSPEFQDYLVRISSTSTISTLSITNQKDLEIPFPSVEWQRQIAHILGTLDDKIELNRKTNETLEAMAKALFKSWFVDFDPVRAKAEGRPTGLPAEISDLFPDSFEDSELGEIPRGWSVGEIEQILNLQKDSLDPASAPDETFDHYSIPAFDAGKYPAKELGSSIKSQKFLVGDRDLLVSKLNPSTTRVWIPFASSGRRAICSTEFLVCRTSSVFGRAFAYCLASSDAIVEAMTGLAGGTSNSHQRIRPSDFLALPCCIGTEMIRSAFLDVVEPLLGKSLMLRSESRSLSTTRDALLPKLISGEIRIPDAEKMLEEVGI